ncbi:MAG TPA: TolC family protein [Chromatiales bacterium]|nr:TolC family protein [Chromatiales bacterium]
MIRLAGTLLAAVLLLPSLPHAAPLPEPLTLGQALALADAHHPLLERARAELEAARAELLQADSSDDLEVRAELEARWVKPPTFAPQDNDDSRARLRVDKRLYDFGRTEHRVAAARLDTEGRRTLLELSRRKLRLQVMQRFFEVLLADLEFARDNEEMAVVFVRLDKARKKNELGQLSDIDLLALETRYQEIRSKRYRSEARQRLARQRLALLLGRPEDLPDTLAPPVLDNDRPLPEYEELVRRALADNPELQALRAQLEGAAKRLEAARASARPVITGRMEATHYQRSFGYRDPFRASLAIDIPLYVGDRRRAEEADAWARLHSLQARLKEAELTLREQLLDSWQRVQTLKAQRDQADTNRDYRELYLDRSRTRYEQELTTDLGDAMVRQSEARLLSSRTEFELALAWATLDLLTGREPGAGLLPGDDHRANPPDSAGDTP